MIHLGGGKDENEGYNKGINIQEPVDTASGGMHDADGIEEDEQDKGEGESKGSLEQELDGSTEESVTCQSLKLLWSFLMKQEWEVGCGMTY